jgi:hypothetical protein
MRSSRLLIVLPAATALVFAGAAPAMAGGDHHDNDDAWAKVLDIGDEAELDDDGHELEVKFEYKCEDGDDDDVSADVVAEKDRKHGDDTTYEVSDVDLKCDGDARWITVTLKHDEGDVLEDGDEAEVTVTLTAGDESLDSETETVDVVDDVDDDDDGDHHKRHHDDDDKHHGDH